VNVHRSRLAAARVGTCLCVMMVIAACQFGPDEEITSKKPYSDLIGAKYRVVSDQLRAYGVYESLNNRTVNFVELVPLELGGPEFAYERPVPKGQNIKLLSAWRHSSTLRTRIYYLVAVEHSDLPEGVPVRLELSRGNEGGDADLNPSIYNRIEKPPEHLQ